MDDFEAALAAKVAPPEEGETATGEEVAPEEIETPAEDSLSESEDQQTEDRPDWLPDNFRSVEDFQKSYREAQTVIDRQGNELGELRQMVASLQTPQSQPQGSIREALEENPEQVAYWAASQGNEQILDAALAAWHQRALDENDAPSLRKASAFERQVDIARLRYEFSQEVMPSVQAVREEANTRALVVAKRELSQQYSDFDQVLQAAGEDGSLTQGINADLLDNLRQTDPKAALELVYATASARQRVSQPATETRDREADLQRKREATVATSSSAPAERKKEPMEVLKDYFLTPDAHSVHHSLKRD